MEAIKHRFFFNGGMKTYASSSRSSGGSNSARTSLEPGACSLLQSHGSKLNPLSSTRGLSAQRSLEHGPDLRLEGSRAGTPKASALSKGSQAASSAPKPSNASSASAAAASRPSSKASNGPQPAEVASAAKAPEGPPPFESRAPSSCGPQQLRTGKSSVGKPPLQKGPTQPLETHFEKIDISANDVEDEAAAERPYSLNPHQSSQQRAAARSPAPGKTPFFSGRGSGSLQGGRRDLLFRTVGEREEEKEEENRLVTGFARGSSLSRNLVSSFNSSQNEGLREQARTQEAMGSGQWKGSEERRSKKGERGAERVVEWNARWKTKAKAELLQQHASSLRASHG